MPRRSSTVKPSKKQTSEEGNGFGIIGGSSQRSVKEMFGQITGGTSQVLRSIKEQFASPEDDDSRARQQRGAKGPKESFRGGKSGIDRKGQNEQDTTRSRRSKVEKSIHSKRGLKSGITPSGRVPQARGSIVFYFLLCCC